MRLLPVLAAALAGCSAADHEAGNAPAPRTAEAPPGAAAAEPRLEGSWTILAIDGRTPGPTAYGQPPGLVFTQSSYGGNAGCNAFGGTGLQVGARWFGDPPMSTQMGCGEPLAGQDAVVQGLLASGPRLAWAGTDRVTLATDAHRVELQRAGAPLEREAQPPANPTGALWSLSGIDGRHQPSPDGRRAFATLALEGEGFRLETPCAVSEGRWGQEAIGTLQLDPEPRVTRRACKPAEEAPSMAMVAAVAGHLRYATGPNGELVIAGGDHWVTGEAVRRGSGEEALIQGVWEVDGGPSAAERNGARPANVRFAGRGYYLWDGCNHTEGLAILYERVLHSFGSGLSTLANCPQLVDERLKSVVTSRPSVATLPGGGLLLRGAAGEVRLRKVGPAGSGATVSRRLGAPMRFQLLAPAGAGGTLDLLAGGRFRLTQPCGVTEGRWRAHPRDPDGQYRFGPDRPNEACERDPEARALQRAFLGNVEVAIGPNRDMALFVGRFGAVRARMERR